MGNRRGEVESVIGFLFLGSRVTADSDCSHEIKRLLPLGRKAVTNLDSILKTRDITLPTMVCLVKAVVFPVVMCGCESWTIRMTLRRPSTEVLMLSNRRVREDSWESLGLQGEQRSLGGQLIGVTFRVVTLQCLRFPWWWQLKEGGAAETRGTGVLGGWLETAPAGSPCLFPSGSFSALPSKPHAKSGHLESRLLSAVCHPQGHSGRICYGNCTHKVGNSLFRFNFVLSEMLVDFDLWWCRFASLPPPKSLKFVQEE